MNYEILKMEVAEGVATVTVSRPQAMNALNTRFFQEMDSLVAEIAGRTDIKVVVITGDGKAFVAGADIAEMVAKTPDEARAFSRMGQRTFRSLELLEKPVIAAVNGFALGGGCELALACDLRVASTKAKFGQPEVNLGLIPGYAATQRLPRLIGLGNALFLLLTGEMVGAEEALRMGLVQKTVEPEALMPTVLELARTIASKGPLAVRLVKRVAREGLLKDFESGCALEAEAFGLRFGNEGAEGMKAFLEKRKPDWKS
ncbi:MAG: enoyl-CoA hydratase-related protein [Candidatus Aminicenantales bacterium]